MSKKILILGAGYAGISAAMTLQKKKKRSDDIEITVIEKNSYHTLLTELHEVAGNRISEDGIIVPLRDIFNYTDVKVIKDEIKNIDFAKNEIISETSVYKYDYLIISAGSQPNYYNIPGMQEYCFSLWSYKDALRIRERIIDCFEKALQEKDHEKRKALLTFVIGGGGFTGVEMAGELAQWSKVLCEQYSIPRSEVEIKLIEALPSILRNLSDKNVAKAMKYMTEKLKVDVLTNAAVTRLTEDFVELKDGRTIPTKTLIWTAGIKAAEIAEVISNSIEEGKQSRIKVNEYTQTQYKNVYAAGDISAFNTGELILPALVEAALQTGKAAAENILADIRGKEKKKLKPKLHGAMVSIGSSFAVSEIMGRKLPVLISILMKYMVNIHYLFGIGGFELVFGYIKDELLYKRHKKFELEKHLTYLTPAFWLVPIRIFLGYSWLKEGLKKIGEHWLTKAMLAGTPPDGGSSASVTEAGETVFRIVSDHTPKWYAWIADNIVVPNALFFQIIIVLSEIGIGLALISGTFTFIAGIAALGLNINFLLSTGLYEYDWWYIPAALCVLGGAGRAFGVDHYLMPYLMRQWRYFTRNKRIKLFLFN